MWDKFSSLAPDIQNQLEKLSLEQLELLSLDALDFSTVSTATHTPLLYVEEEAKTAPKPPLVTPILQAYGKPKKRSNGLEL